MRLTAQLSPAVAAPLPTRRRCRTSQATIAKSPESAALALRTIVNFNSYHSHSCCFCMKSSDLYVTLHNPTQINGPTCQSPAHGARVD